MEDYNHYSMAEQPADTSTGPSDALESQHSQSTHEGQKYAQL